MRGVTFFLLAVLSSGWPAAVLADDLQTLLDRHLREEVPYWLDEPRLLTLLGEASKRNETLDAAAISALDARWQAELAGNGGELSDHVASRFGSKYLAEVALRLDGVYGPILALDNRGLVIAASELPEQMVFAGDVCVSRLAQRADAAWVQDRKPATGLFTRVALPVRDDAGARIGTLLFDVDVARLQRAGSLRDGDTRLSPDATTSVRGGQPAALPAELVPRG